LNAVEAGVLPREAFNKDADGLLPRTTTGAQAAATLKLLHEVGAPTDLLTVLTNAYGVDVAGYTWTRDHLSDTEYGVVRSDQGAVAPWGGTGQGGTAYVPPARTAEASETESTIFLRNPDLIDRGTTAHKDIQDGLAEHIRTKGLQPLSPAPNDQPFDVAWESQSCLYICEVKSLTDDNEESQLRLGLGQLLSYLYRTNVEHWPDVDEVLGVLAVERRPNRSDWVNICADSGITLTWPDRFPELFHG